MPSLSAISSWVSPLLFLILRMFSLIVELSIVLKLWWGTKISPKKEPCKQENPTNGKKNLLKRVNNHKKKKNVTDIVRVSCCLCCFLCWSVGDLLKRRLWVWNRKIVMQWKVLKRFVLWCRKMSFRTSERKRAFRPFVPQSGLLQEMLMKDSGKHSVCQVWRCWKPLKGRLKRKLINLHHNTIAIAIKNF